MSAEYATTDRVSSIATAVAVAAGSSTAIFRHGKPANVKRIVLVMTAAQTAAPAVATVSVQNRDGTSSVALATFSVPVAPINTVLKAEVAAAFPSAVVNSGEVSQPSTVTTGTTSGYQTSLPGEIKVNPGQQLLVAFAAGGSGGTADVFVEYQEQGNNPLRFNPTNMPVTRSA